MAYPVAPGGAAYSGVFIPEIWAGKLLVKFYDASVLTAITNTDYEGSISQHGDKVKIRQVPDVTIRNYTKDMNLTVERPTSTLVELDIDKGKYWNTILDDVNKIQSDINLMDAWGDDSSEQMKITIQLRKEVPLGCKRQSSP